MFKTLYFFGVLFLASMYVLWVEGQEGKTRDAKRRRLFWTLDEPCISYLQHTKDRPTWRLAWLCASAVTFLSTLGYAACANAGAVDVAAFCLLVWFVSFAGAQGALSYYAWHLLCPHYTCSKCDEAGEKLDE